MIKTLRITTYFAVVLAVVFFVSPAVSGVRGDKQIEEFLNSVGAIEEFKQARGDKIGAQSNETSPLVKQAERFALYLNPPAPEPSAVAPPNRNEPRPKSVSPKFRLVGTSRHALYPQMSLALIDEPGKGLRWVRPSSKVGHLIIEQVKDGIVVVRDGQNSFEIVAERPVKKSLLKAGSPGINSTSGSLSPHPQPDASDESAVLRGVSEEKSAKAETMRITAKEAKGLGQLGRRLRKVQRTPANVPDQRSEDTSEPDLNKMGAQADVTELSQANGNDENVPG